ncbi:DUF2860 family protein [Deferribacteres bacterium DY0037]
MKNFIIITLLFMAVSTQAAPQGRDGFSGNIDIGMFGMNSTDALMATVSNEDIDTLSDNPDSFSRIKPIVTSELRYKKGDILYHAGTPPTDATPQFLLGTTFLYGKSSVDLSVILAPFGKVWKDPYVSDRKSTRDSSAGLRLKMENISGTRFGAKIQMISHDIDNDAIGRRFSDMKRNGETYSFTGDYKQPLSQHSVITPFVTYTIEDRNGDAMSGQGLQAGFKYLHKLKYGLIIPSFSIAGMWYNEDDSVFDKTRTDTTTSAFLMYKYFNPFGLANTHINFLVGGSLRSSNIDFYDARTVFTGVTFGYDF